MSDENLAKERPTPPPIPKVDRATGKISNMRPEDVGQLDGWASSTSPFAGGVSGTRFNDAQPESERKADADEFHKRSSSSVI
jgi:hypothetical protein